MRKPLKVALIVVGSVIGLLVLVAIVLVLVVDPNRYRDDIVRAVKTHTGRDLQIEGKLKLSVFPWLGLQTGALQLGNAPGFGPEPMARVESAGIQVELLPLLRKQVRIDTVHLRGLNLNLARDKQGRTNWDDLMGKEQAPEKPKQPSAGGALAALTVQGLDVRNANITWNDAQSGARYAVRGLDLTSGNLLAGTPAPIKLSFDLETGKPPVKNRIELNGRLGLDPNTQTINAPELRLAVGPLKLNASVNGTQIIDAPKFTGRLELPNLDARPLLKQLGVAYAPADSNALRAVALSTRFNATTQSAALSELSVTLDETKLTGSLALQKFSPPAPKFDLAIDKLDLDRYLPAAEKSKDDKAAKETAGAAVAIPLVLLREADAQGKLKIQKLKAFGINSEDVLLQVAAKNGLITLGPNQAKLYGGSYNGRTNIDANAKPPRFQFDEKLTSVRLGPFLKDAKVFDRFSGMGNLSLTLTAAGLNADAIKQALNGKAAVDIKDGAIEGIDIGKWVAKVKELRAQAGGTALNLLSGLSEFKPTPGDKTPFTKLQASATVTNGVVDNRDLAIAAANLSVTGSGKINLVTGRYERYMLRVSGVPCTFVLDGPLAEALPKPDCSALIQEKAQEKKKEFEEKAIDRLRKRLQR